MIESNPSNHQQFDDLLNKKGWDTSSKEYSYLLKFLSWGAEDGELEKDGKYNYFIVFKQLKHGALRSRNIDKLTTSTRTLANAKKNNNK